MDSSREPEAGQAALKEALDRNVDQVSAADKGRVAVLEAAAAAFAANRLSAEERAAAHGAAHKLAGTLGTFGLDEAQFWPRG